MRTFLLALIFGGAGLTGALLAGCNKCDCPEPEPYETGTYVITKSNDAHVVSGTLVSTDDTVVVTYEDATGATWKAHWTVTDRI
jgi:hypothetical protein